MFIINKYRFPTTSDFIGLNGSVSGQDPSRIVASVQKGRRGILWTKNIKLRDFENSDFDVAFLDYAEHVVHSSSFTVDQIHKLKKTGLRIFLSLPLLSANNLRFYAKSFFNGTTGEPTSSVILDRYNDRDFLTAFWENEWKNVVFEFLDILIAMKPTGVLIRDIDLYAYLIDRNPESREMAFLFLEEVVRRVNRRKIRIILETREFFDAAGLFDGLLFPLFFKDNSGMRTNFETRMESEKILAHLRDGGKEIYLSDFVDDRNERLEFIDRTSSRSFIPVLRTKNEDSMIDPVITKTIFPVRVNRNAWNVSIQPLPLGESKVAFKQGNLLLNTALVRYSYGGWPDLLNLPSKFHVFGNDELYIGDKMIQQETPEKEGRILGFFRSMGLDSMVEDVSRLEVFVSTFERPFGKLWFDLKELRRIIDRFTFPIVLRRNETGIEAKILNGKSVAVETVACNGTEHHMVLIRMSHRQNMIFLAIGDEFSQKAFAFVLNNIGDYGSILDDESVSLITASTPLEDVANYLPNKFNISVVPLIEKIR